MIKIERKPCINCWDIEREWGLDVLEMSFAEMAENDSYIVFNCSDSQLKDLERLRFDWQNYPKRVAKIQAEIDLWHKFRNECGFGADDEVLILISY